MLFGDSSWAETSICEYVLQVGNGDVFGFTFIIDQELGLSGVIDQQLVSSGTIDSIKPFDFVLDTTNEFTLALEKLTTETLI